MTTETTTSTAQTTDAGAASAETQATAATGTEAQSTTSTTEATTMLTETTAEAGKAGTDGAETTTTEADKPAGAPEKYEAFTAPEGQTLDADVMTTFEATARELNLPQDKAQMLVDKMAPVMAARQQAQMESVHAEWRQAATTDTEFGGDKLQENLGIAKVVLDKFGSPELKTMLNQSGLGNNPELIRLLYRAGKAISPDTVVTSGHGNTGAADSRSHAATLYPSQQQK